MKVRELIPLQGTNFVSKGQVPAGKATRATFDVLGISLSIANPTGDTSKAKRIKESIERDVFAKAAEYLQTSVSKLEPVSADVEEKVLDRGRELKHAFIDSAIGKWVIRLFSWAGEQYSRIEAPNGKVQVYKAA